MKRIQGITFMQGARHSRQVVSDLHLDSCTFDSWAGFMPDWDDPEPSLRPTLKNLHLTNSNAYSAYLDGAIIEDVVVDRTKAGKAPLFLRANAYKHVILRGRIAPLELRGKIFPSTQLHPIRQAEIVRRWDEANARYYESVDWALDVTEAQFGSLSVRGVPARLIRRDPQNSVVITRQAALDGAWKSLPWRRGVYEISISWFLEDGYDDLVLFACTKSRRFKDDLADLELLKDAGVAHS
jgi:hypothetical protein